MKGIEDFNLTGKVEYFTPKLKSSFSLRTWGHIEGFKIGKLCVVSFGGLISNSAVTTATAFCELPYEIDFPAYVRAVDDSANAFIIQAGTGFRSLSINAAKANVTMYGEIVFTVK